MVMNRSEPIIQYSIFDPTGNITALVESEVEISRQPALAAELMRRHPGVEQVGFVRFAQAPDSVPVSLRMAGGEFCGNASMSAAALYLIRKREESGGRIAEQDPVRVMLRVSGAEKPVEVQLKPGKAGSFDAGVHMPPPVSAGKEALSFGGITAELPVVRMEGIFHIILEKDAPFSGLIQNRESAEEAVKKWCADLSAAGLGLMFLGGEAPDCALTPLVYIPGSETVFWENSCASGSAAAGMYLSEKTGEKIERIFREPGGSLRTVSEAGGRNTWLYGSIVRIR